MCFLSTGQILLSELRVEGNKSSFTFYHKSINTALLATPNLWSNIQIVRTCIPKHNISNPMSLAIKHLDFETLHYCFEHASDEVIHYILDNIEDTKKIHFLYRNISTIVILLERYTNTVSLRFLFTPVSL